MSFRMYFDEFNEQFFSSHDCVPAHKVQKTLPTNKGEGYLSAQLLNTTIFTEQCLQLSQDMTIKDTTEKEFCFISFILEGKSFIKVNQQASSYHFSKNSVNLGISKAYEEYTMEFQKGDKRQYAFNFSKDTLLDYLIEFDNPQLIKKVESAQQFDIFNQIKLTSTHHFMIEKMLKNPYHGSLQKLYFETCANELMIMLIRNLSIKKVQNIVLYEDDKLRIKKAKEILLQNIQEPPTIQELAKMVAINQDKLKKGFKVIFNNTIFKTLTEQRMKIAYEELQKNDMSIAEIAYKTGYMNVSNFISVFRKKYGVNPGQMRKEKNFYWFE